MKRVWITGALVLIVILLASIGRAAIDEQVLVQLRHEDESERRSAVRSLEATGAPGLEIVVIAPHVLVSSLNRENVSVEGLHGSMHLGEDGIGLLLLEGEEVRLRQAESKTGEVI